MKESNTETIPEEFASVREASDFWDAHDAGDYTDLLAPVNEAVELSEDIPESVALEHALSEKLKHIARRRGVSLETLVNVWLEERATESPAAVGEKRERYGKAGSSVDGF